jgi:hypothetical protein
MDSYHKRMDTLIVDTCTRLLQIADELALKKEYHVGRTIRAALRRHHELLAEEPRGSQPTDEEDVNVGRLLGRLGVIDFDENCRQRMPPTTVIEYPRALQGQGLGTQALPAAYAEWFLKLLKVDDANQMVPGAPRNWYPIHFACDSIFISCQPEIIKGLLDVTKKLVLNTKTEGSQPPSYSPLMFLCAGSNRNVTNKELVELLVEHGAATEARDAKGNTPFLKAASVGMTDVCRTLVGQGCDKNATNERGANAATLAQGLGNGGGHTFEYLTNRLWLRPTQATAADRPRKGVGKQRAIRYAATMNWWNASTLGGGKGGRKGWNK